MFNTAYFHKYRAIKGEFGQNEDGYCLFNYEIVFVKVYLNFWNNDLQFNHLARETAIFSKDRKVVNAGLRR